MLHTRLRGAIVERFRQVILGWLFVWVRKYLMVMTLSSPVLLCSSWCQDGSFTYRVIRIRIQENPPATLKGFEDFLSDEPIRFDDLDAK